MRRLLLLGLLAVGCSKPTPPPPIVHQSLAPKIRENRRIVSDFAIRVRDLESRERYLSKQNPGPVDGWPLDARMELEEIGEARLKLLNQLRPSTDSL